jgi:hypothetical protein
MARRAVSNTPRSEAMPNQQRTVTLNVNLTPPVTIIGGDINVDPGEDIEITWKPADGQTGWSFSKITLSDKHTPLPNPPFSRVQVANDKIKVDDDNKQSGDNGTWNYSICVTQGTSQYWSDPEIINKGN